MNCRTAVYRLYNGGGLLLYIGMSRYPRNRFNAHVSERSWWPEVTMATLEWYDTRDEARTVEVAAIHSEHPCYNVAETPLHRRVSGMKAYLTDEELEHWTMTGSECAKRRATSKGAPAWTLIMSDRDSGFYDPATFREPAKYAPDPARIEVDLRSAGRRRRRATLKAAS